MEGLIAELESVWPVGGGGGGGGGSRTQSFLAALEQMVAKEGSRGGARKARCWATQHCWLLVVDPVSLQAALWDPVARDRVDLPRLADDLPKNCKCLLSHEKPTSHGCVALAVDLDSPAIRYCRVDGHHQQQWHGHAYSFEKRPGFQIRSVAAAHGDFYFSLSPTELVRMELMCLEFSPEPRFTAVEHGKICLAGGFPLEQAPQHLVGSVGGAGQQDELLLFIQYYPLRVGGYQMQSLWRMDFLKREWTKVWKLNGRVLLLGPSRFAASLPADELGVEDSCVYLVREEDMVMQILRLKFFSQVRLSDPYPRNPEMSGVYTLATKACGFDAAL